MSDKKGETEEFKKGLNKDFNRAEFEANLLRSLKKAKEENHPPDDKLPKKQGQEER